VFTPDANVNGDFSVTYEVTDGTASTPASLGFSLDALNDAPTNISLNASSVDENAAGAVIGNLTVTDPDAGDSHTFSVDDNRFEVVKGQLKLKDGVFLDYEALNNGQLPITVTAKDAGGLSYAKNFTINVNDVNEVPTDTTPPNAPTSAQVAGDDIVNSAERTAGVTVSGIAEANSTLNITWGSTTQIATADASGNWSSAFSSAQIPTTGSTTLSATARDAAGNTSTTGTRSVLIDTVAPNAPTITNVTDNVGSIQGSVANAGFTDDSTPTLVIGLTGTNAVAGDTLRLFNGTTEIATQVLTSANISAGNVSITPSALLDGSYSVTARITDVAGNQSVASTARSFTLDTLAPTAPTIAQVAGDDIVNSPERTAGVTITGIAEANSTLNVTWGSTTLTATADASGNWSRAFNTNQIPTTGSTTISATARDAAGNTSTAVTRSVLMDTVAPNAPTITNVTDNVLLGGDGNDILVGGSGDDILTGGAGNDQFVYQAFSDRGTVGDTITDFNFSQDKLVLTELLQSVGYACDSL
jgi:hypothetical protein